MIIPASAPTAPGQGSALVIIDPTIDHYPHLLEGLQAETEVLLLDPAQNAISQITQVLSDRPPLTSLHLISHGRSGELQLGSTRLNLATVGQYALQMQQWAKSLMGAEVLLYGCEVAADELGKSLVRQISQLVGTHVAAATTLVGSAKLGGSWNLGFSTEPGTGRRRSPLAFNPQTLETYPAVLALLVNESFTGADVTAKPWIFGTGAGTTSANPFLTARTGAAPSADGIPGAAVAIDTPNNGTLRLTDTTADQAAFVIYNAPISANGGVSITFDFFAYNGTAFNGSNGDGISFFLIDGTAAPTTAGAFGGSLGYAQKQVQGISGITGGYLGVGFDEFGNFSTSIEPDGTQRPTPAGVNTPVRDSVSVRGSQASGYAFLTGTGTLAAGIDVPSATTRDPAVRRAKIDLTPTGVLGVQVDLNGNGSFADAGEQAITNFNVAAVNGALPSTFKFGFASSTGGATNIHEVRNLVINTFTDPPVVADATVAIGTTTTNLTGLSATDPDGTIATYTLSTLPPTTQGTLFLGNPSSSGTAVTAGQVLTPAQITQLFFQPASGFSGATFTYTATDNQGATDSTPATVTLSRTGTNRPPTLPTPTVPDIDPGETTNLTGLAGSDPDGSITSYTIASLPPAAQGRLFLGNPNQGGTRITVGQVLTPTQIEQLFFQAGAGFSGTRFTYGAIDNGGTRTNSTITLNASAAAAICRPGRTLKGNSGGNSINGTANADTLIGFAGNDVLNGRNCNDRISGGRGNDRLSGEGGSDTLQGGTGGDRANGGIGADRVSGGLGRDFLNGAAGNDRVTGDRGDDVLRGNNGRDTLDGGLGNDRLFSGNGNDLLNGGQGNDLLNGERDNDRLSGNSGRDRLNGGRGQDTLIGGISGDILTGSGGADVLQGGRGRDRLVGGTQNDRISGGTQGDFIVGGGGADTLTGGTGRDRFVYRATQRGGVDVITDFQLGRRSNTAIDQIDLTRILGRPGYGGDRFRRYVRLASGSSAASTIVRVDFNGSAVGGFQALTSLEGIRSASLSARNFLV
ncbi:MAG: DUF4347 domain-containing protein [Drouetiella hepatica Uher 2000/2452]|jgi:Ca2+-binding RTX toxin-like protein|uniref:DUF4347 domain-containing protein n=1 Tax=Drouetiella hepatica Uher 2000/2452 TaxID=904376 RepID=A0A951QAC1_9CYAN|nr:DUF4347 domain-containing protein [Drouetiella hepatica Uher 2000/2452]